ncbi:hypothetical protein BVI434_1730026 [Burkholderia vietnamiensis]|nr:hypothetical protein BVI434_1730026 [Burkholderia vietnamiensis]
MRKNGRRIAPIAAAGGSKYSGPHARLPWRDRLLPFSPLCHTRCIARRRVPIIKHTLTNYRCAGPIPAMRSKYPSRPFTSHRHDRAHVAPVYSLLCPCQPLPTAKW